MKSSSFKEAEKFFKSRGAKLDSILDNGEQIRSRAPIVKDTIFWTCLGPECGHISKKEPYETIRRRCGDGTYLCTKCKPNKPKKTYRTFVNLLESEGYSMISPIEDFENVKTKLIISCNIKGHDNYRSSLLNFEANHRCGRCSNSKETKYDLEEIAKEFAEKGFTLLSRVYKNTNTPLDYICSCGNASSISYQNFRNNKGKCEKCIRCTYSFALKELLAEYGEDMVRNSADIPHIRCKNKNGQKILYTPDIYIPSKNLLIAIERDYETGTFDEKKFCTAAFNGYKIAVWSYNEKNVRTDMYEYYGATPQIVMIYHTEF
jgi:hypothetical protein